MKTAEEKRAYHRAWRAAHPETVKLAGRRGTSRYQKTHPEAVQAQIRVYREKLKNEVLTHYSPDGVLGCSWPGCFVDDIDELTLDHLHDDGAIERKGKGPIWVYINARQQGYPKVRYQTLCWNHQWKKRILGLRARQPNRSPCGL